MSSGTNKFPYTITKLDEKTNKKLMEKFNGERTGFVQVGPEKYLYPERYVEEAENFYNFPIKNDDVWVVTFPRSGTTLIQEMVWLLANNFDYLKAKQKLLSKRFPFLDFCLIVNPELKEEFLEKHKDYPEKVNFLNQFDSKAGWKVFESFTKRRFIKTHLPFSLLPPELLTCGCKIIYVARNPKDVAVSLYHLNRLIKLLGFNEDFETFWNFFENNLVVWSPYWSHVQEGWTRRNQKNFLFLFYENVVQDLAKSIREVSNFLEIGVSEEQVRKLVEHLKIENFKKNSSLNLEELRRVGLVNGREEGFIRNGGIGNNFKELTPILNDRIDIWVEKNLKRIDITFPIN